MTAHSYSGDFMEYAARSSAYSAGVVTAMLYRLLDVKGVLGVGCARGTWLRAWSELGIVDLQGVDGDYVDRRTLEVPETMFAAVDLNAAFDLGRQFDLVQSLEVGEHIHESASDAFVESLAKHARRYVLFSAAPSGQGGEHHINEQAYEFWRNKFEQRDFVIADAVRPAIIHNKRISFWYRYLPAKRAGTECLRGHPEAHFACGRAGRRRCSTFLSHTQGHLAAAFACGAARDSEIEIEVVSERPNLDVGFT